MSSNIVNSVAFLRTSREFPQEIGQLTVEVTNSYIDIANAVNARTIGLFPVNRPAITGNSWFLTNRRQQTLRQVYVIPSGIITGSTINIGFKIKNISQFSPFCYGTYTDDGTNWYGLIFASSVPIVGQVSFYLKTNPANATSDQIVFEVGAGAPTISSGNLVLEWLSDV